MSIGRRVASVLEILGKYRNFLSGLSDEEFQGSPEEGVWSYSEVYSHVLYVNKSSLIAIERCAFGNKASSGSISWRAWLIFFLGRIPARTKAPDKVAAMVQKISLEDARNDIIKLQEKLPELISIVRDTPGNHKVKHPRLGMLNASQWLRFMEIHSRHHLKQLKRIGSMMNQMQEFSNKI